MTELDTDDLATLFKALGVPVRLRIVKHLINNPAGDNVPTMIAIQLNITLPTASYGLKQLYEAKFITRKQSGRYVFYSINEQNITALREFLS